MIRATIFARCNDARNTPESSVLHNRQLKKIARRKRSLAKRAEGEEDGDGDGTGEGGGGDERPAKRRAGVAGRLPVGSGSPPPPKVCH